MDRTISPLERTRLGYRPVRARVLAGSIATVAISEGNETSSRDDGDAIRATFPDLFGAPAVRFAPGTEVAPRQPLTVGVVLSGGQAPGGHNVITGLYDALAEWHDDSRLIGFLAGPKGIFESNHRELKGAEIDAHRNTGGFDLIGSGRDKIETPEQLAACRETCACLGLDGLVVIGGDDSNTNAAVLAQYFVTHAQPTAVVGAPKTIDGDLKGGGIEASFGFDTATKVYAELIGNVERDARSARKYWHFIKLMGRSASHVTLECALSTRPNIALIGEEVRAQGWTLEQLTDNIAAVVRDRAEAGRSYGVCLVPEGLIEFLPEVGSLIEEINRLLAEGVEGSSLAARLTPSSAAVFVALPERIRDQLLIDRDSHGNVQVSRIDTEALLIETVRRRLEAWSAAGDYNGRFQTQHHFFGYEGRCAAPSNFDANYTAALGQVAALLIAHRKTGYICCVGNLALEPADWTAGGLPLTALMQMETRKGQPTPVIAKALVDLDGAPFGEFAKYREVWKTADSYVYPGPIQYFGPEDITDRTTLTLQLEGGKA
jgi:pyrophosphate--fructose-6-phosphate 1-phosphotransferase